MGCGRQFCPGCGEELIHRDNRQAYESASALGQIVYREGGRYYTAGDIDLYIRRVDVSSANPLTLLRLIEHKQPDRLLKTQQQRALRDLDSIFTAVMESTAAGNWCPPRVQLHPGSGVYILRGEVVADEDTPRATHLGPHRVFDVDGHEVGVLEDEEAVLAWIAGRPPDGNPRRRGRRA